MARAGITVDRLVAESARIADEEGFDAVTPSALARRFGVQVASLYSHVASAHDLKKLLALHALERLADEVSDAVVGRSGGDAITALADVHRRFARTHPGLFVASRYHLDDATAAGSAGVRLARLMRASMRDYRLGDELETHAVRMVGSAILGFITLEMSGSFSHSAPDAEASWTIMLEAMNRLLESYAGMASPTEQKAAP